MDMQWVDKLGNVKILPDKINGIKILGYCEHRGYNLYVYAECPECKNQWITARGSLTSGKARRCKQCTYTGKNNPNYKHGELCQHSGFRYTSSLYSRYYNMINRCINEKEENFKSYGAKGVIGCDEWLEDFNNFKTWALSNGYSKGLEIHRVNVKGNYEPSNCIFLSPEAHRLGHKTKNRS